jgi:serine/threonine protein kinase
MHRVVWSPLYIAPEMLEHQSKGFNSEGYTEEIDVWSLGVVLFNVATGTMPFDSVEGMQRDDMSIFIRLFSYATHVPKKFWQPAMMNP